MASPNQKSTKITDSNTHTIIGNDANKSTGIDVRKTSVTKRLQTELQSLITFAAYNSRSVLLGGTSCSKNMIISRLYEAYMPSSIDGDDCMSFVEMCLKGKGRFKHMYVPVEDVDEGGVVDSVTNRRAVVLRMRESLYCIGGMKIVVGADGVNMSLLARKNLTNHADIKANT